MVAATVKFALETKMLAEEWNGKDAEERDWILTGQAMRREDSDIDEDDWLESPDR